MVIFAKNGWFRGGVRDKRVENNADLPEVFQQHNAGPAEKEKGENRTMGEIPFAFIWGCGMVGPEISGFTFG